MKNIINEVKKLMDGLNIRMEGAQERISELIKEWKIPSNRENRLKMEAKKDRISGTYGNIKIVSSASVFWKEKKRRRLKRYQRDNG